MAKTYEPLDLNRVRTVPLESRKSKVQAEDLARPWDRGGSLRDFLDRLPGLLAAADLRTIARTIVRARERGRPVIVGLGAHVVKVGLTPVLVDLLERGIVTVLAANGAVPVHDFELATVGATSEEVEAGLGEGQFGMAEETGRFLNEAAKEAVYGGRGFGRTLGEKLVKLDPPHVRRSLFAAAARLEVPITVHVALGTDIVHMHPACDPAAIGEATYHDFRLLAAAVGDLGDGGVYLNIGSAVLLPEVFLKALTLARNLGHAVRDFTTVNLDFIQHYRPTQNVVRRPVAGGGRGFALTGHHELLVPLLAAAIVEGLPVDAD
jgi:hypothetical protein